MENLRKIVSGPDFVRTVLAKVYGIEPSVIKPLKGHSDINFYVRTSPEEKIPASAASSDFIYSRTPCTTAGEAERRQGGGRELTLKFKFDFTEGDVNRQSYLMDRLHCRGFQCPRPIPGPNGNCTQKYTFNINGEETELNTCLQTFLPGKVLFDFIPNDLDNQNLFEVGQLLAELHQATKEFSEEELLQIGKPGIDDAWHLENTHMWESCLPCLQREERLMVENVIREFEQALPKLKNERIGIIHGDLHDENLIVLESSDIRPSTENSESSPRSKYGIIDFECICHSCYVYDLGTTMSFFMISHDKEDFFIPAAHILAGYRSKEQLSQIAEEYLYLLICLAHCRELVICTEDYQSQGGSNSYLLTSLPSGWPQLRQLWQVMGRKEVYTRWNDVLESYGQAHLNSPENNE